MKSVLFILFLLCQMLCATAQVTCSATASSGNGYAAFRQAGFGIEDPDCVHGSFGAHITQTFDETLQKNVFEFHSHIEEDNDRCVVFDRVRMEIKGGPNTNLELQHRLNDTTYYRWKFRITKEYVGSSRFHHIFQLKAKEGDDSFPVITITLRANTLEVLHNAGDNGVSLGLLSGANLEEFKGRWIEGFMKIVHKEQGSFEVTLNDLLTNNTIVSYQSNNIDLWRTGAIYNRPKWGMYRAKTDGLKDEMFRFADFCISESEEALCPADSTETISSLENQEAHDIQIYPNPTKKHLFVQSSAGNIQSIQLVDASGKTVLLANKQEKYMLDISTLPKGVYLLLVEQKDKKIVREKVFVME